MMGIYPDCPGTDYYQFTSPVFDEITIKLDSTYYTGKKFIISTDSASPKSVVIESMELNNQPLVKPMLQHIDIIKGGRLKLMLR